MSKYCPKCGEELADEARFCKSCGAEINFNPNADPVDNFQVYGAEEDHQTAIIIGYILAILVPLFGVIAAVYLLTRTSMNAKKHGKYILIVAIIVWIISFLLIL